MTKRKRLLLNLKVKTIEDVLKGDSNYKPEWESLPYGGMENPKFGKVEHVVVCNENETPLYDQYIIHEKEGAVILPFERQSGIVRVGLITRNRHASGKNYVEVPRGFGIGSETTYETAIRELFEETGLKAKGNIIVLGRINPNNAFYKTDFPVAVVELDKIKAKSCPSTDPAEFINNIKAYRFSEIQKLQRDGLLECGITKAALFEFGCFMPEFYDH